MSKQLSPSGRMRGQTVLVTGTTKGGIGTRPPAFSVTREPPS